MEKTKKVMTGITSTALIFGLAGCGTEAQEIPPVPDDPSCSDWEWDYDDGVWECDDFNSRYLGYFFYGGRYYKDKSSLYKNNNYSAYKKSSAFKGSSGFGSGSKSYGG